jgi:chemotaxis protein CheZ
MMASRGVKEFSAERQLRLRGLTGLSDGSSAELLAAIAELRNDIGELRQQIGANGGPLPASDTLEAPGDNRECREARIEIAQMVRMLGRAKLEIASIKHPMAEDDRIKSAASELDAIVAATEASTQDILAAGEEIESLTRKIAGLHHGDEDVVTLTDQIAGEIIKIFEACNFQDITGQRVDKVVRTIRFVEERLLAMIAIWGAEAFADLPLPEGEAASGDEALMNGPALGTQGISQDEINALFD